jgi:hypothetical protein
MSEMPGALLKDVQNCMTASQHIKCTRSIARLITQSCAIHIPYYDTSTTPAKRSRAVSISMSAMSLVLLL